MNLQSAICTASSESLPFLISLLRPNNPLLKSLKTPMTIIENAGGILRNISSQISTSPELRKVLREHHCYEILLEHLKSCSLIVVSNACGTLWNLSGGVGCEEDQRKLLDLNAVPMLKNLIFSKHERISQGASAALRNLLSSRFAKEHMLQLDSRLTAHIYSPNPGPTPERGNCNDSNQESPGSDGEFEFEFGGGNNVHHQHNQYQQHQPQQQIIHHPPMAQQEPPVAHQHSSAAAASIFQRVHTQQPAHSVNPPLPSHFHAPPPSFSHPGSYMNRPTSINYSIEPEPLDLTLTSAKSSPIHIISAAEFGIHGHLHHTHSHHRTPKSAQFSHAGHYQTGPPKQFYNSPAMLHQNQATSSSSQCNSPMRFNYPGAKFNRSCPEILSRLNSGHPQINNFVPEQKPLDYSSNSPSATSSLRGAGEAAGSHNDSANGGDTTFNYSLQYTEEDEDDRGNSTGNGGTSKSEDTLKTYCYEGTPHNFSISNSCQDLVQEIEMEKAAASAPSTEKVGPATQPEKSSKLQPIDEAPKSYYVENTPAVFSRTSSLSSINSSGGLNAGEHKAEPITSDCPDGKKMDSFVDDCPGSSFNQHQQNVSKRRGGPPHGTFTPSRVTFSAEETPLMFSRCSSVASLDSLDVGGVGGTGNGLASHNDDDLSDFSRRASEVVSPSDLPDSPREMAPPIRVYEQPINMHTNIGATSQEKQDGEDDVKVFSMEEKSGLNSCRSLSPLMIDGEELPILGKKKLPESDRVQDHQDRNRNIPGNGNQGLERNVHSREGHASPLSVNMKSDSSSETKHMEPEKKKTSAFPDDEVRVFAMEGTPFYGVSNATSLSDLTMDLDQPEPPKPRERTSLLTLNNVSQQMPPLPEKSVVTNAHAVEINTPESGAPNKNNVQPEEPIYSDAQLLQKCIRIGKSVGIPKSKSEYKITHSESMEQMAVASNTISGSSSNLVTNPNSESQSKKTMTESRSHHDFDDPDLAALIMKGRNRPKEKERSTSKSSKAAKACDKNVVSKSNKSSSESESSKSLQQSCPPDKDGSLKKETVRIEVKEVDEKNQSQGELPKSNESSENEPSTTDNSSNNVQKLEDKPEDKCANAKIELKLDTLALDPSQISTTSLGSEWNDETPTFSSPLPSMSISTAFKIVGGNDESSMSKPPMLPPKSTRLIATSMQSSMLTMSVNNELLDNIDPPSTFSNLVSSSDCVLMSSPPMNPKMQGSSSDKLSRKWKALNEAGNTSSIHSNLSGQRPPLDLDLENSMISVASIKSEIYELSSTASYTNDIFQSAVEDIGSPCVDKIPGLDTSIGGNTYTIFPPENVIEENGKSKDLESEGGNTVVSDDFTDAEEIEDYETAPADDPVGPVIQPEKCDKAEKSYTGKPVEVDNANKKVANDEIKEKKEETSPNANTALNIQPAHQTTPPSKPLMEVHPLEIGSKYNTFRVNKSPMSPRASPKQKRRDDPERYKTHTIAALQAGRSLIQQDSNDNNGNPLDDDTRFNTFRVGGPKIVKPVPNVNSPSVRSSQSNSPESTPGNSPKGIRGRRKPLYSSLPPSAIAKKRIAPPVPPKPTRNPSPVRPPSVGSGGVYVRPTRTSELRIAANSRDNSPNRGGPGSRTSSNSSLNLIHNTSQEVAITRPKIAPKPPVRTSASSASSCSSGMKPFSGSTHVLIKTSNSSFGFGQQKVRDGSVTQNMKGYSTLPKSSKLGGEFAGMYMPGSVPSSQNGESKESIPGSEKSQGKMGRLSNLFKKMDFHRNSKDIHSADSHSLQSVDNKQNEYTGGSPAVVEKKSSKFSNFFGRKKDKSQPKPFRDSDVVGDTTMGSGNIASIRGNSGVWVRRDGENKAMVAPFNYVPPPGHPVPTSLPHQQQVNNIMEQANLPLSSASASNNNPANPSNGKSSSENVPASKSSAAGSAKITTV